MNASLVNRSAIITGANQGLGRAIAGAFVEAGASVMLCARTGRELEQTAGELRKICRDNQRVESFQGDVSSRQDVEQLVSAALAVFPQVHILVNNAGVYGPKGRSEDAAWDEWVHTVEVNLLGSVLVARQLLPHFRSHHYGKVIQLSGGGATAPLPFLSAYAASKAGVVRFMETLAEELKPDHIDVNSIAPGALNTRLLDEVLEAGPEKVGRSFYEKAVQQKADGGAPLERGAALAVFLASALSDGLTGKLISAIWDPWESFPEHLRDIQDSDIYTLRRILPKDRGQHWADA